MRCTLLLGSALLAACAAEPPPKPAANADPIAAKPAELVMAKAPLKTPKPCLTGESSCGGGVCDLVVKNGCDGPLTCDVSITSACKTNTGFGQASGRKRATFAAKADDKMNLAAYCVDGDVVRTEVADIKCQ
jgi:hypothetical protein